MVTHPLGGSVREPGRISCGISDTGSRMGTPQPSFVARDLRRRKNQLIDERDLRSESLTIHKVHAHGPATPLLADCQTDLAEGRCGERVPGKWVVKAKVG